MGKCWKSMCLALLVNETDFFSLVSFFFFGFLLVLVFSFVSFGFVLILHISGLR